MRIVLLGAMHSSTPTTINTLTPLLSSVAPVKAASPFKNRLACFLDLLRTSFVSKPTDLVFILTYSTKAFYYAWACALVCRLKKVKYIAYLHGGSLPARMDRNGKWLNSFFDHASAIVTPSSYLKTATEKRGYGPVSLIPNFINIKDYSFKKRETFAPKLLWVRAFHNIYHPEMAIRVLAELNKKYDGATLCMVGPEKDGSMENCRQLAVSLNLSGKVKFTGKLTKNEWTALAAECDIFINTTNIDNTPVSVIEAMALGLPVVSTNVGGIPYLVKHASTARLVNKGDVKGMTDEICFLLQNSSAAKKQMNAARKLVEAFAWDQIEPKWITLINQLHGHHQS